VILTIGVRLQTVWVSVPIAEVKTANEPVVTVIVPVADVCKHVPVVFTVKL